MSKFDDGGAWFPLPDVTHPGGVVIYGNLGASAIDEFAKESMSLASDFCDGMDMKRVCAKLGIEEADYNADVHWPMLVARQSYHFAAAMVAEKRRREGGGT